MTMKKYVIERNIIGVGALNEGELCAASKTSNDALRQLAPRIQWVHSYVTGDKTFCIYLAEDEAVIQEHATISGFPANIITEVSGMIEPITERA